MGVVTGVPGADVGSMLHPVVVGPRPERLFRMRFHLMPGGGSTLRFLSVLESEV